MFELNKKNITIIILIIAVAAVLFMAAIHVDDIGFWLSEIKSAVAPLVTGLCMAFVINIPLKIFENKIFRRLTEKNGKVWRKIKRPLCLVLSIIFLLGIFSVLFSLMIPEISESVVSLAEELPQRAESLIGMLRELFEKLHISTEQLDGMKIDWNKISQAIIKFVSDNSFTVLNSTVGILSWVIDIILSFTFSIYLLASKEKIGRQVRRICRATFPQKVCENVFSVSSMVSSSFEKFIAGQCTEALIIGVLCFIGMMIFGIPYALMVSSIIAITALIPIVGAFLGTAVGAFMILLVNPLKAVWFVLFIIILQQIESNLIYPRVVGSSVGLPGIWVLASVTVGGSLFGIPGMFIGVPVSAVLYCLIRTAVNAVEAKRRARGIEDKQKAPEDGQIVAGEVKITAEDGQTATGEGQTAAGDAKRAKTEV